MFRNLFFLMVAFRLNPKRAWKYFKAGVAPVFVSSDSGESYQVVDLVKEGNYWVAKF
jgi:hypothetical protein